MTAGSYLFGDNKNYVDVDTDALGVAGDVVGALPFFGTAGKLGKQAIKRGVNYGNDIIQTSKQAGKLALPKYKDVYRVEHAGFDQAANVDNLTGRWFADNPIETKFYAQN